MKNINFICSYKYVNLNNNFLLNQCYNLKAMNYDFIKLEFNTDIQRFLKKILNVIEKTNIKLILSIKDNKLINKYKKYIKYFEVFEPYEDTSVNIILNTTWDLYCEIKNKEKYFNIIINNIENIKLIESPNNIGIYLNNDNNIWYSNYGINFFYINENISTMVNDWSMIEKKIYKLNINFSKIFNDKIRIIISGVSGQDGSNLVEYLINNVDNIIIFGTIRNISTLKNKNLKNFCVNEKFVPLILNLCDEERTKDIFVSIQPNYFFNCAAQSVVNKDIPITSFRVNTMAPLFHMECIKNITPNCKYLSCGSCEEFGETKYFPQDLNHECNPINIYGITKLATHNIIKFYRKKYNLYACHIVLYNHEGIKRGSEFVSRKISKEVARIKNELDNNVFETPMSIGNIFSKRDWSDSEDFVEAFWKILNYDIPQDYILSSGKSYTIKKMIDIAFEVVNIKLEWINNNKEPLKTKALYNNKIIVEINKNYYRENDEKRNFVGNNEKIKNTLNWTPKISFKQLIRKMVTEDINNYIK